MGELEYLFGMGENTGDIGLVNCGEVMDEAMSSHSQWFNYCEWITSDDNFDTRSCSTTTSGRVLTCVAVE